MDQNLDIKNEVAVMEQAEKQLVTKDYAGMFADETNATVGKDWTTFDLTTEEQRKELLSRITGNVQKLMDNVGSVLTVEGVYIENVEMQDKATGEVKIFPRILLCAKEGTYSTMGITVFNSMRKLMKYLGMPTKEKPLKVKVSLTNNNGKQFYSLTPVK